MGMAEHLYQSGPKIFELMGRSTNHSESLKTNPQIILSILIWIRKLHWKRKKASATKSLVSTK